MGDAEDVIWVTMAGFRSSGRPPGDRGWFRQLHQAGPL